MEPTAKIMVVDDEKGICQNVAKILSRNNYEVACALSAREALDKMAQEPFSLLISDVVMPGMNGLELLRQVNKSYPHTRTLMMTAYPSIDTAHKSIRLGASDYLPKPFTPDELRKRVAATLSGELAAAPAPEAEIQDMPLIDVDMPFDRAELAKVAGEQYADSLGPSDMPVIQIRTEAPPEHFCQVGEMVCDIFRKLGATCKAGTKSGACPQKKAGKRAEATVGKIQDVSRLVGVDMPFAYDEVAAAAGADYAANLQPDGFAQVPYEILKARHSRILTDLAEDSVLVIDDEVAVNNSIRKALIRKGYAIDQAVTKDQALAAIATKAYKVVLLDLKMPGVKGLELLKAVRTHQPKAKVVIVTGYASIETAVETARLGAVGYVAKPFTPKEIRGAAETALRYAA